MAYLLDSNIFIESRKNLPMDVWTTFWSKLSELAMNGQVVSSVKVKEEIAKGYDELSEWVKEHVPAGFFLPIDSQDMVAFAMLQNWAMGKDFTDTAKNEFATNADAYIIATACAKQMTLVTFEKSNPQRKSRVMIPDACAAIGVACCDLNTMLRSMGITI
jgi:predicted nucleic acid-binding protein